MAAMKSKLANSFRTTSQTETRIIVKLAMLTSKGKISENRMNSNDPDHGEVNTTLSEELSDRRQEAIST